MNGPVACLFRVRLEALPADKPQTAEAFPVEPQRYSCEFRVAASDAEAAVASACACMRERLHEHNRARVVSVEIIDGIDAI
jgi:hypothetical protein